MTKRIVLSDPGDAVVRAVADRLARHGYAVVSSEADLVLVNAARRADAAAMLTPVLFAGDDAGDAAPHDVVSASSTDRELILAAELALCRQASARAAQDFERFFAVSIDMFCFLGFDGHFRRLNPAWERTLGFTREELMSRRFIEFVHPDDRERTLAQNGAVRGGGRALGFENRYLCKDGSYRWFLWNSAPFESDRVIYAVARDITERKLAEDERARLLAELQVSLAEVRTLRAILPICSYCKKIRDDEDYWSSVESYISRHTGSRFSHGICPHCMETVVEPQLAALERE